MNDINAESEVVFHKYRSGWDSEAISNSKDYLGGL